MFYNSTKNVLTFKKKGFNLLVMRLTNKGIKTMSKQQIIHNTFKLIAYLSTLLMVFPLYEIIQVVIQSSSNGFIFINNLELSNRFFFNGVMPFLALGYTFLISSLIALKTIPKPKPINTSEELRQYQTFKGYEFCISKCFSDPSVYELVVVKLNDDFIEENFIEHEEFNNFNELHKYLILHYDLIIFEKDFKPLDEYGRFLN